MERKGKMIRIFKIAVRNLMRYKRRTMLTSLLITLGVLLVILFSGLSGSFKAMMIGQITDANLSQIQIHKRVCLFHGLNTTKPQSKS